MLVRAHAKVNLGLNVVAKRGDGYHEVDTLMARLELHDALMLEPAPDIMLSVSGADLPTDASNLAYEAAQRYLEAAGETRGVRLSLDKRIPVAAGLGGGSSDAAAALRGLSKLYPSNVDLETLAKDLGADVPFFLSDTPAARARGRGEKLEPLTLPTLHLVLVNPGIPVSAGDAYANLQNFSSRLDPTKLLEKLGGGRGAGLPQRAAARRDAAPSPHPRGCHRLTRYGPKRRDDVGFGLDLFRGGEGRGARSRGRVRARPYARRMVGAGDAHLLRRRGTFYALEACNRQWLRTFPEVKVVTN